MHDEDASLYSFIADRNDENCHNFTVSDFHVMSVLHRMDINEGSSFDGVASIFLREFAEELLQYTARMWL